ncbi:MAG: hypothetical protein GEV06_05370 [Luteitalea sp.]|nr:hypothetical protein [Luteitalea sp.]
MGAQRRRRDRSTRKVVLTMVLVASLVGGARASSAQSVASSTIHGIVKDDTDATLPGVTVTLSSPALQVGQTVGVTDESGSYRFGDLPAGIYRLTFELTGFNTIIRDELRITIGFTARVDATMGVGQLQESVMVSGQSPVVDLSSTGSSANFTEEALETIPRGRDLQAVVEMAPGVSRAESPDVGGSQMAERPDMST